MKNLNKTAKFDFKKTTITVFNKQAAGQVKYGADTEPTSSNLCPTLIPTGIWTTLL